MLYASLAFKKHLTLKTFFFPTILIIYPQKNIDTNIGRKKLASSKNKIQGRLLIVINVNAIIQLMLSFS